MIESTRRNYQKGKLTDPSPVVITEKKKEREKERKKERRERKKERKKERKLLQVGRFCKWCSSLEKLNLF